MKITLNGQIKEFNHAFTLLSLIAHLGKDKTPVVAEVNGEIIKTPHWEKTVLKEGDTVELVGFVGGG
jgi:thiamine biosynthesis protein ThiS